MPNISKGRQATNIMKSILIAFLIIAAVGCKPETETWEITHNDGTVETLNISKRSVKNMELIDGCAVWRSGAICGVKKIIRVR